MVAKMKRFMITMYCHGFQASWIPQIMALHSMLHKMCMVVGLD